MTYFFTLNQYGGSNKLSPGQAIKVLLPTQTGNAGKVLSTDGSTLSWTSSSVTSFALTKTDDTNVTLTLGGSPNTALLAATSLTLGWTGTLADSRIASAATWNAKQNALGFTPENVANKQSAVSTNANHYYNAPYINSVLVARIFIASDQTTTSNAAANITGLVTATLAANKTYIVRGVIAVTSAAGAAGGVRIGATLPTGATSIIFLSGRGSATTMTQEASVDGALQTTASNRIAASASDLIVSGNITTSSTAGTVQFRFASGTNLQSNSVIAARTYIEIFEKL
jgi:hypothetical protein